MESSLPAFSSLKNDTPQTLATYGCRETVGVFNILKWTISVGVDTRKKMAGSVVERRRLLETPLLMIFCG